MTDVAKNINFSQEDMNRVHVRGTIVNKFILPKSNIIILTISSATLGREIPNYPKIVFKGDLKAIAESFPMYANVDVVAKIQSSRRILPTGEKKYGLSVIGLSISETERTMAEAFDCIEGGSYLKPVNQVKLIGTIISTFKASDNVALCTVKTVVNGVPSFNKASVYSRNAEEWLNAHPVGTRVAALGEIQTTKKERDNEVVHYENIVLKEIQTIS